MVNLQKDIHHSQNNFEATCTILLAIGTKVSVTMLYPWLSALFISSPQSSLATMKPTCLPPSAMLQSASDQSSGPHPQMAVSMYGGLVGFFMMLICSVFIIRPAFLDLDDYDPRGACTVCGCCVWNAFFGFASWWKGNVHLSILAGLGLCKAQPGLSALAAVLLAALYAPDLTPKDRNEVILALFACAAVCMCFHCGLRCC